MHRALLLILTVCIVVKLNGTNVKNDWIELPRFWTNVGFSPVAPLPLNSTQIASFLLSNDVQINIELIAALPNNAIETIRIHWLLSLIETRGGDSSKHWSKLDTFLDHLHANELAPAIELMGDLIPTECHGCWFDLVTGILKKYTGMATILTSKLSLITQIKFVLLLDRYSSTYMTKWRFETWNEPDLKTYNIMNMTISGSIKDNLFKYNYILINISSYILHRLHKIC